MAANLDPYIGQSIAAYVGVRGPPQAVIDLDKNKKMFQSTCATADPVRHKLLWVADHRGPEPNFLASWSA